MPHVAAPPPDMRRGSAPPLVRNESGLGPWFGLRPNVYRPKAEPGA